MPLDPGRGWLAAGITGIARQREWDAVAAVDEPGDADGEVGFVFLPDGSLVLESGAANDPGRFARALADSIAPPYRALAVRHPGLWTVGAVRIEVAQLDPGPRGADLELTWDGSTLRLTVDRMPAHPSEAAALERLAGARARGQYAAYAHRLRDDLFEVSVLAL